MRDRYGDVVDPYEDMDEKLITPLKCKREKYEFYFEGRAYCSATKECLYKSDEKDLEGRVRCMNISK